MEDNNSIAHNKSGEEDHLLVLCDKGYKSGKHFIEFVLETEPCENAVILGVTLQRNDYYFNISDAKNFWGFIVSEGKKIHKTNSEEITMPCKMKDVIGLLMEFNKSGLDLYLYINGSEICSLYKNLPIGQLYYPSAVLKFDGMKVRVTNKALLPKN